MNYNSEGLSDYARRTSNTDLMHFATAWDEEVSALKKDKSELRELCILLRTQLRVGQKMNAERVDKLWNRYI